VPYSLPQIDGGHPDRSVPWIFSGTFRAGSEDCIGGGRVISCVSMPAMLRAMDRPTQGRASESESSNSSGGLWRKITAAISALRERQPNAGGFAVLAAHTHGPSGREQEGGRPGYCCFCAALASLRRSSSVKLWVRLDAWPAERKGCLVAQLARLRQL